MISACALISVSPCIMSSLRSRGKVSRPRVGLGEDRVRTPGTGPCVRPKVGLGTDWVSVSRCVMFAAVPRLASRHSRLLGRSGDWWWPDSGRPHIPGPALSSLSSPDWLYIRARLGGIKTTIKEESQINKFSMQRCVAHVSASKLSH